MRFSAISDDFSAGMAGDLSVRIDYPMARNVGVFVASRHQYQACWIDMWPCAGETPRLVYVAAQDERRRELLNRRPKVWITDVEAFGT